ncbi:MAG: hypothetical protein JXP34_11285, partial [Planctomycetes bacterium]|nr:hypothetical protein [Planctomycetota bacterium]
ENGWEDTTVTAGFTGTGAEAPCLLTANAVGARFGDNYDWDYDGTLTVRNSIIIHNLRDVWGREWDSWTERTDALIAADNWLGAANPAYPDNAVWDPAVDAERLAPFLPAPDGTVGIGFATRASEFQTSGMDARVPVRLSTFSRNTVSVDYALEGDAGDIATGTLAFAPGETVKFILLPSPLDPAATRLVLRNPVNAEVTGLGGIDFVHTLELIASGDEWRFYDKGSEPTGDWKALDYADGGWGSGPSQLGNGDGDEATPVDIGPSDDRYRAIYFRRLFEVDDPAAIRSLEVQLLRDDGGIVWLNGQDVFRSNMPSGDVTYSTWASGTVSDADEDRFYTKALDPSVLVAGTNVIAVEVHQINATSSDISFDLELIGTIVATTPVDPEFIRGDANGDGSHDIGDAVTILSSLFANGESLCADADDVNGDDQLDIGDPIGLLNYLFAEAAPPAAPFPACGTDPTQDTLTCERYPLCK